MSIVHTTPFEGADKAYDWNGAEFIAEDWWDRLYGESWAWSAHNPAALTYAMRLIGTDIPDDDEVVYGRSGGLGHLAHVSELKGRTP